MCECVYVLYFGEEYKEAKNCCSFLSLSSHTDLVRVEDFASIAILFPLIQEYGR